MELFLDIFIETYVLEKENIIVYYMNIHIRIHEIEKLVLDYNVLYVNYVEEDDILVETGRFGKKTYMNNEGRLVEMTVVIVQDKKMENKEAVATRETESQILAVIMNMA